MSNKSIAVIRKNAREEIHIGLSEYAGHRLANLRVWYNDPKTDELRPGKHGLAVRLELLDSLINALVKTQAEARALGLLTNIKGGARAIT